MYIISYGKSNFQKKKLKKNKNKTKWNEIRKKEKKLVLR